MRKIVAVTLALSMISGSAAVARKKPEMSALELQQMQARDYEAPKSVTFPAAMTILQDSGYRITTADKDTGLITGSASTNSHTTWVPFVGFGRSKKTPVVSVFVEDRGAGSRVRLNFVLTKAKSMMYGMSSSDEEPITDAAVYQSAFERLEKEIFVRQAMAGPAHVTAATSQVPTASTTPIPASADTSQQQGPLSPATPK
ncbi:hypothetical protein GCM10022276_25400 [Sphingomonas limnosediminicola]|uniref:DUF4410 domain-containing protein n=1 Tax=Sphingomonas limnosediminicola TaxID=940133 RepID=A0ABP7LT75_9SPHN